MICPQCKHDDGLIPNTTAQKLSELRELITSGRYDRQSPLFLRLLEIVEEIEKRPSTVIQWSSTVPGIPAGPYIPPTIPNQIWPPHLPYVGDSPGWLNGKNVCTIKSVDGVHIDGIQSHNNTLSVPDATGTSSTDPATIEGLVDSLSAGSR